MFRTVLLTVALLLLTIYTAGCQTESPSGLQFGQPASQPIVYKTIHIQ